ncbi:MAG: Programmed cell death toxin MazF like [uncultured Sphingosinicella sp.]|uniref:Programmed cell death toxin MazF like n=1 Tax=uncultured Sphingosinicella sp. TaxID=478748 RepID=A0A6J4U7C4_9SPHN|nr:PIN domain-containing protein [uncultured Sphingosinicella sp.]CAA9540135.1 MAG: Programmed cell death toxin MazF like [uncultured Sphingosinicella sp.]
MRAFLDTNVLVYAFSHDSRADKARLLLDCRGLIGVQCLNEFANVARTKLKMSWDETQEALVAIADLCEVTAPIDLDLHHEGLALAERYQLSIYDGLIVAAALRSRCDTLWSEDMQNGMIIEKQLTIRNPFAAG